MLKTSFCPYFAYEENNCDFASLKYQKIYPAVKSLTQYGFNIDDYLAKNEKPKSNSSYNSSYFKASLDRFKMPIEGFDDDDFIENDEVDFDFDEDEQNDDEFE